MLGDHIISTQNKCWGITSSPHKMLGDHIISTQNKCWGITWSHKMLGDHTITQNAGVWFCLSRSGTNYQLSSLSHQDQTCPQAKSPPYTHSRATLPHKGRQQYHCFCVCLTIMHGMCDIATLSDTPNYLRKLNLLLKFRYETWKSCATQIHALLIHITLMKCFIIMHLPRLPILHKYVIKITDRKGRGTFCLGAGLILMR